MFCTKCGAKIDGDAGFCSECGNPVTAYAGGSPMPGPVKDDKTEKNSFLQGPEKWLVLALAVLAVVVIVLVVFLVVKRSDSDRDRGRSETDIEQDREEEKEEEDTDSDKALMGILQNIFYYGDIEKCTMTAEQAAAYAQLIADGMAGKVKAPEAVGSESVTENVSWNTPYEVRNVWGDTYMTDRANVMLADLAGDGNPYLYVYSSTEKASFEVYGWDGNAVNLAANWEGNDGRVRCYLLEDTDGRVKMFMSGSSGAEDNSVEIYSFSGGTAELTYSLTVTAEGQTVHCIENGVDTTYPYDNADEAYEKMEKANPEVRDGSYGNVPDAWFYGEMQPSTISEMLDNLGQYAVTLGYDSSLLPSSGGEAAQAEPEQPAAVEEKSPWLVEIGNCIMNVDLSACVPADRLEEIRQNAYGDILAQAVNKFYKFSEPISITSAAFAASSYDEMLGFTTADSITYRVDNSNWMIVLYKVDDGRWESDDWLLHISGSEGIGGPCIIYTQGLPNSEPIDESRAYVGDSAQKFYRSNYKDGDPVMYLEDADGTVIEIPVS